MKLFLFLIIFFSYTLAIADTCKTQEACPINVVCQCDIMPSSSFERFFYFNFENIEKGKVYYCYLNATPKTLKLVLEGSIFPIGSVVSCLKCPVFPVEFTIDTTNMKDQTDSATVKYFVPASDTPNHVTASCLY